MKKGKMMMKENYSVTGSSVHNNLGKNSID